MNAPPHARSVARLHWGCDPHPPAGWINSDRLRAPGIDLCGDIREVVALDDRERETLFVEATA